MSFGYFRIAGNERFYVQDNLGSLMHNFVKRFDRLLLGKYDNDDEGILRLETTLQIPTIGGSTINHRLVLVGLDDNKGHWSNEPDWAVNISYSDFLHATEYLQLNCFSGHIGISHDHSSSFNFDASGFVHFGYRPGDVEFRFAVAPWTEERTMFHYGRSNYVYLGSKVFYQQLGESDVTQYQLSDALRQFLGVDASVVLIGATGNKVPENLYIQVRRFDGFELQHCWRQKQSTLGPIKKLHFLFQRPGDQDKQNASDRTELLFLSDYKNATTTFWHLNVFTPWGHNIQASGRLPVINANAFSSTRLAEATMCVGRKLRGPINHPTDAAHGIILSNVPRVSVH
ncbi:unnamed protein product [Dicrocoelium dendriticum]|nr:unnamed protein product [Dicrocoelium dendriticum]